MRLDTFKVKAYLRNIFSCDLRSLALLRIGVGSVILVDLFLRSFDLTAQYSDAGAFPRNLVWQFSDPATFSLYFANGSSFFAFCLMVTAALLAISLIVGYRTRLVTLLSWLFLLSLHQRNRFILFGGDYLLSAILLWGIFIPWGAVSSVDSWRSRDQSKPPKILFSMGTVAYVLQIVILYTFSILHKWGPAWVSDGSAIYYSLSIDDFATPTGQFLLNYPVLMKIMTLTSYLIEALVPFLLFLPFFRTQSRLLIVFLLVSLQIGIGLSLNLGMFPLISIASTFGLLPSAFWDRLPLKRGRGFLAKRSGRYLEHLGRFLPYSKREAKLLTGYFRLTRLEGILISVLIVYILVRCTATLLHRQNDFPVPIAAAGSLLEVNQYWVLFAEFNEVESGWYVLKGTLANGEEIDLLRDNRPPSDTRPVLKYLHPNERWQKAFDKMTRNANKRTSNAFRLSFLHYRCNQWPKEYPHSPKLVRLELIRYVRRVLPEGATATEPDYLQSLSCLEKFVGF